MSMEVLETLVVNHIDDQITDKLTEEAGQLTLPINNEKSLR